MARALVRRLVQLRLGLEALSLVIRRVRLGRVATAATLVLAHVQLGSVRERGSVGIGVERGLFRCVLALVKRWTSRRERGQQVCHLSLLRLVRSLLLPRRRKDHSHSNPVPLRLGVGVGALNRRADRSQSRTIRFAVASVRLLERGERLETDRLVLGPCGHVFDMARGGGELLVEFSNHLVGRAVEEVERLLVRWVSERRLEPVSGTAPGGENETAKKTETVRMDCCEAVAELRHKGVPRVRGRRRWHVVRWSQFRVGRSPS